MGRRESAVYKTAACLQRLRERLKALPNEKRTRRACEGASTPT
ncbi:hypothetical protein BSU04_04090 [Caballeronia sordidicola]|uniref:Uncharacterized protein n=1 Tax=Caballeronia sordidicola TaxID=196367 RepID=A0A226X926_CABSO|nr:hypothetical protein BSU04_04090 [Caballeronia sordidicola]